MNRPTFHSAVASKAAFGGFSSRAQSSKDIAAHTTLKFRQHGQSTEDEMKEKDLKTVLEQKERDQLLLTAKSQSQDPTNTRLKDSLEKPKLLKFEPEADLEAIKRKYDDSDAIDQGSNDGFASSSESDSDSDDDDEDDEEELQRELERIKAERALAQAKKEQEERELQEKMNRDSAVHGNPLVDLEGSGSGSSKMKRRWNDDVVFRNQAKDEVEVKKRFINDTIRNDFHKSFLKKYVK